DERAIERARAFAEPLLAHETLDNGENTLAHADAVAHILDVMGGSPQMKACAYLVYACRYLNRPRDTIAKAFGEDYADVALETTKLVQLQHQARIRTAQAKA
ncbi:HD domain-containing protein, partial [Arthrospira platensis SPKY1]|nr:HD domain-containing protein [Arthrospira platensis SPKY1]